MLIYAGHIYPWISLPGLTNQDNHIFDRSWERWMDLADIWS